MKLSNATTEPPKILTDYWQKEPQVCWNCDHYSTGSNVECRKHGAVPPPDFAEADRACPDWADVIPF